ncbi:MAG: hypothetical protein Q9M94_04345 [Candidatus Gracilibacteria bacterium]|nr:hypothetical protein [Candidatus Gracilibacteria bacterium]
MKKAILAFLVFSIFFLIGCEKYIKEQKSIDNKKVECDSSMNLWKNKTYNFSMCLPSDYLGYGAYGHSMDFNKKLNTFIVIDNEGKQYIGESDVTIGSIGGDRISFYSCSGKKGKKYLLGKLEVFDCLKSETDKYKSTIFIATIHNKKVNFNFNKNNKEHIKIINSIKPLTEK